MNKFPVFLMFFAISCGNDKTNIIRQTSLVIDSTSKYSRTIPKEKEIKEPTTPTEFFIKDQSKYSTVFLKEFREKHSCYKTVTLVDDSIIINNDRKELVKIPTDLPLNTLVTYETSKKETKYILTVKRINYSTLEYNYYETLNGQKANQRQGLADLEPVFYFGAEGTFEDESGNTFGMNEYIDGSEKDCWNYIYIGIGSIEKSFLTHSCATDKDKLTTPELTRTK